MYEPDTLDSTTKNKLDYINQVKDCIKQIWARGTKNQQESYAKDWTARYSRIVDDCLNAFEEPKVCARMMYIKYHKENPSTRDLNKNHDTDFYTLLKEAKQYFEGLKKWEEDDELLNELNKQATASTGNTMNKVVTSSQNKSDWKTKAKEILKKLGVKKENIVVWKNLGVTGFSNGKEYKIDKDYIEINNGEFGGKLVAYPEKGQIDLFVNNEKIWRPFFEQKIPKQGSKVVPLKIVKIPHNTKATSFAKKVFAYKGQTITASTREDAIKQIVTSSAKPFKYKGTIVYAVDKEKAAKAYMCAMITKDLVKKLKPIVKKLEVTFYEDDHYKYNSWNKKTAKDKLVIMAGGTYDYNEKGKNAVAVEIGWEHGKSTYDCIKPEDMERYITNDIIPVANSFMRKHKGFSAKPIIKYLDNCDLYRVIYVMEDKK